MSNDVNCHKGKCKYREETAVEELEEVHNKGNIVEQIEEDLLKEELGED